MLASRRCGVVLTLLLAAALLPVRGARCQEAGGLGVTDVAGSVPTAEELADGRAVMLFVVDGWLGLAEEQGWSDLVGPLNSLAGVVPHVSDEDAVVFVQAREELLLLERRIQDLRDALAAADGTDGKRGGVAKSAGFPDPDYSVYCGDREIDSDALFVALMVYKAARLVKDIALDICNQIIIVPIPLAGCVGGNTSLACIISDTAFNVAEIVFGELEFCDNQILGDRMDAVYERMEHLHDDLEKMAVDLDFIRQMLTCVPVVPLKVGSGCNGTDDDCDTPKVIDECDEDVFGPTVYIQAAAALPWYSDVLAARNAVREATVAVDDCQTVIVATPTISGTCGAVLATVTATDACGNSTTATLTVKIDGTPPQVIIPPALGGTCFTNIRAAEGLVLAQAIIVDDCTPRDQLDVRVESSLEGCDLRIRIDATNLAGLTASDAVTVRIDPDPPVIAIDQSVSAPWYRSVGEALAAVMRATHVTDDCQAVTVPAPTLSNTCGAVVARVTATDSCGNGATAQATVRIDSSPPVVTFPAGLSGQCFPTVEAAEQAARSQALIIDDCTARVDMDVRVESSLTECMLRVHLDAFDLAGRRGSAAVSVKVDPMGPRVAIDELLLGFRSEVLGFQTPKCYRTIADAQAAVLAVARATDNCASGSGPTITVSSAGTPCALQVTARAADSCGSIATDVVSVRVDNTAPAVTCSVATNRLTPADKRMVDVGLIVTVTDGCETGIVPVVTVTSDESAWNGGTSPAPDAQILRDASGVLRGVRLRAEYTNPGDGRVYKINVRATDACGNTATTSCQVVVPNAFNQNFDSGQYYDAAAVK